ARDVRSAGFFYLSLLILPGSVLYFLDSHFHGFPCSPTFNPHSMVTTQHSALRYAEHRLHR
ncbi:MAG: hypothetical protein ABF641_14125, partial [Acetobacter sp.]